MIERKQPLATLALLALATLIMAKAVAAQAARTPVSTKAVPQTEIAQLAGQAQVALSRGDYQSAIRDYERLVKAAPAVAELHLSLGVAYYSSGRPANAVAPLRQALKLKPQLEQARSFLGAALADSGQCQEALGYIPKDLSRITNKEHKRMVGLAAVRCGMRLNQTDTAVDFIRQLNRGFPDDAEVLYLTVHIYSDLSIQAAQGLLIRAPSSYQVRLLNAEALETQGRWDEAEAEYRQVLATSPRLQGIHYRLGRLLLSAPSPQSTAFAEAKREFEEELKLDPGNAGAAYVLGELERRDRHWPEAIENFLHATKFDPLFADAFIGLGRSLIANNQFSEAVAPLERAVKLQPDNPVAHYHLGIAYSRLGRKEEADRESTAFREISEKSRQSKQDIQTGILGPQKAEP